MRWEDGCSRCLVRGHGGRAIRPKSSGEPASCQPLARRTAAEDHAHASSAASTTSDSDAGELIKSTIWSKLWR